MSSYNFIHISLIDSPQKWNSLTLSCAVCGRDDYNFSEFPICMTHLHPLNVRASIVLFRLRAMAMMWGHFHTLVADQWQQERCPCGSTEWWDKRSWRNFPSPKHQQQQPRHCVDKRRKNNKLFSYIHFVKYTQQNEHISHMKIFANKGAESEKNSKSFVRHSEESAKFFLWAINSVPNIVVVEIVHTRQRENNWRKLLCGEE